MSGLDWMDAELKAMTTFTCPAWCTRKHGVNELACGDVVHRSAACCSVRGSVTFEQVAMGDGKWIEAPTLEILLPDVPSAEGMDAATARSLAAALIQAAERVEGLEVLA